MKYFPYIFTIIAMIFSFASTAQAISSLVEGVGCIDSGNCGFQDLLAVIRNVFLMLRQIAFWIAIGFGIYGGIRLILSQGNPNNIKQGRGIIIAAFVGLVIVYGVSLILNTVLLLITGQSINLSNIWSGNFPLH
jgi:hypothetical protein